MRIDLCPRHARMLEKLGEAIRPFTKELTFCEEKGCGYDDMAMDEIVVNIIRAWRAGTRIGLWGKEEPRRKLRK